MNTSRRRSVRLAALVAGLVLAASCTSESSVSSSGAAPSTTAAAAGAPSTTSTTAAAVSNDFALTYTGGTAGPADDSLPPITVGYINQEGGVPAFPEATAGIEAAVQYVNEELGGIGGHPVELETCFVQTEEDGQTCATQMANDDKVSFVIDGVLVVGNQSIYSILGGKKPIVEGFSSTIDDFVAQDAYAYTPGAVGVVTGMASFVGSQLDGVQKVAVVHSDNAAGKAGAESILKPGLEANGITDVTLVAVPDTATGPDLVSAIQAAGVDQADVFIPLLTVQGCIATYDALQSLGIHPRVVTTGLCYGTSMTQHLQDLGSTDPAPDGWYFGDNGYSYFMPDAESGMDTYIAKIHQYGPDGVEYTGFAGPLFASLLTAVKLANQVGADAITPDAMRQAMQSFPGPMMLVVGPMHCGFSAFKALCGSQMGVQQYKAGSWLAIASGNNGQPIETAG